VIFGVGVGWNREEMRNHGTDPRTRGALLDEQIQALKAIWTRDEAEFHGRHVDFDPIFLWPKPVQQPHPPIYVGGNSAVAAARSARLGDGWLPNAVISPDAVQEQLDLLPREMPVTATSAKPDPALLAAYAEAGVERVTFALPPKPESETLHRLDELAAVAAPYR